MTLINEETPFPETPRYAICRTEDCPNRGVAFLVTLYVLAPGVISACQCGICGQLITDLEQEPATQKDSIATV
ncbi:hypothetical protein [Streptomyces sp. NPDC059455]|uniref:hypothetical protein n=1 Tax=Streptomyces sp. NPDC059455 TaxID=3346837 RepID=UPI00369C1BF1